MGFKLDGHMKCVQVLIRRGADVNKTRTCNAPLHAASEEGHFGVVSCLIRGHADVNKAKTNGATALSIASDEGHKHCVEGLVRARANLSSEWRGETPLAAATRNGHIDIMKFLQIAAAEERACENASAAN